ncbi:hypothetical protein ON010_g9456 [Phytophthora cinnamomi]|nr:hypothetical protein ON010_g9456 [Phytophthora cinnamomi]
MEAAAFDGVQRPWRRRKQPTITTDAECTSGTISFLKIPSGPQEFTTLRATTHTMTASIVPPSPPPSERDLLIPVDSEAFQTYSDFNKTSVHEVDTPDEEPTTHGFSWRTLWAYAGPGWLMSIAYVDPGNLESRSAGWGLWGLPAHLGAARCNGHGILPAMCSDVYPRWASLTLWIMTEIAIVGSDIQEVLGSSIAFQVLFGFPLWIGCLITGFDTFTFLLLHRYGIRKLEAFFVSLIVIMLVCFCANLVRGGASSSDVARGFVPRVESYAVTQAVGIVGAVIMPHNIFLHSALVQSRQVNRQNVRKVREANKYFAIESAIALFVSFLINLAVLAVFAKGFFSSDCSATFEADRLNTACVPGAAADGDTFGVCQLANGGEGMCQAIGLSQAGVALSGMLGQYADVIWAIGLLAAGQSSTMTGTYAGQFVMEGFLNLRISPWKRVALTRCVSLVPAMTVAILSQRNPGDSDTMDEMLNVLQSIQLPFALLPVLIFTSSPATMGDFVNSKATVQGALKLDAWRPAKPGLSRLKRGPQPKQCGHTIHSLAEAMTFPNRPGYSPSHQQRDVKSEQTAAMMTVPNTTAAHNPTQRALPAAAATTVNMEGMQQELQTMLTSLSPAHGGAAAAQWMPPPEDTKMQVEQSRKRLLEDDTFQGNVSYQQLLAFANNSAVQVQPGVVDPPRSKQRRPFQQRQQSVSVHGGGVDAGDGPRGRGGGRPERQSSVRAFGPQSARVGRATHAAAEAATRNYWKGQQPAAVAVGDLALASVSLRDGARSPQQHAQEALESVEAVEAADARVVRAQPAPPVPDRRGEGVARAARRYYAGASEQLVHQHARAQVEAHAQQAHGREAGRQLQAVRPNGPEDRRALPQALERNLQFHLGAHCVHGRVLPTTERLLPVPAVGFRGRGGELPGGLRVQVHLDLERHAARLLHHPSGHVAVEFVPEGQVHALALRGGTVLPRGDQCTRHLGRDSRPGDHAQGFVGCLCIMEFLGLVGVFGFLISSLQAAYFEGDVIRAVDWYDCSSRRADGVHVNFTNDLLGGGLTRTWPSALCLLGYIITLFVMYTSTSVFLTTGDAAVFNLSLLTSDFFAVVAAKYLFNEELSSLYFVGFSLIIAGVSVYNRSAPPTTATSCSDTPDGSIEQLLPAAP